MNINNPYYLAVVVVFMMIMMGFITHLLFKRLLGKGKSYTYARVVSSIVGGFFGVTFVAVTLRLPLFVAIPLIVWVTIMGVVYMVGLLKAREVVQKHIKKKI